MKSFQKIFILAFTVLTLFMLVACEEDTNPNGDDDDELPTVEGSITLNYSQISIVAGSISSSMLVAILTDIDEAPQWTSSNPAIASVEPDSNPMAARVRAWSTGTATITVTAGGVTATCTVTVTPGEYITIENTTISLQVGTTDTIIASAHTSAITYETSNASIATVSGSGVVTAHQEGSAIITVKAGTKTGYVTIVVEQPGIELLEADNIVLQLENTPTGTLTARGRGGINPATGTWTIEDDTVASISQEGGVVTITALESGIGRSTTVTFTLGEFEPLTRTVTVKDIDLVIELDEIMITILQGQDEAKLTVSFTPEQTGEDAEVTWSATPANVIDIAADGTITRNSEYVFSTDEVSVTVVATSNRDPEASAQAVVIVESPTKGLRIITNKAEFEAIMQNGANNNANIFLAADIDLDGAVYGQIMPGNFSGSFNGNGHTISNFSATGFFGNLTGTFENVKIVGTMTGSQRGLIANHITSGGVVKNVFIDVTFSTAVAYGSGVSLLNSGGSVSYVLIITRNQSGKPVDQVYSTFVQGGTASNVLLRMQEGSVTPGGTGTQTISASALTQSSTYNGWDTNIWNIVNGEVPSLKQT